MTNRGPWRSGTRAGRPRAIPIDEIEVRPPKLDALHCSTAQVGQVPHFMTMQTLRTTSLQPAQQHSGTNVTLVAFHARCSRYSK